jgi:hypothetical protein
MLMKNHTSCLFDMLATRDDSQVKVVTLHDPVSRSRKSNAMISAKMTCMICIDVAVRSFAS